MTEGRVRFLLAGFLALFATLGLRLVWIQVVQADVYQEQARIQTRLRQILEAPRGQIRSTEGGVLAGTPAGVERRNVSRAWPWGVVASPLLGLVGRDGAGLMGLEYRFDRELRGIPGWRVARRTGRGDAMPGFSDEGAVPEPGLDVITTLHPGLQAGLEVDLREAVQRCRAKGGVALVIDAGTGDILAAAAEPAPADRLELLRGRAEVGMIHRTYEPGSTFKLVTLAAAFEAKSIDPTDRFDVSQGQIMIAGKPFRDSHKMEGSLDPAECLSHSSNVCFAQIAARVGAANLYRTARDFGFGTPTGVDLPGEEAGVLRTVDQWSERSLATVAIGQEVTATPLQVAMAYAAVANGGVLMKPRLVRAFVGPEGDTLRVFAPRAVRRVISVATADRLRSDLEGVVDHGTGIAARIAGIRVGGKTGTSQKVDAASGKYYQDRFMASFVGIVPNRVSPIVCLVVLDEPIEGHTGGASAAPAFAHIARRVMEDYRLAYGRGAVDSSGAMARFVRGQDSTKTPTVNEELLAEGPA